jgi:hypothetical protein
MMKDAASARRFGPNLAFNETGMNEHELGLPVG